MDSAEPIRRPYWFESAPPVARPSDDAPSRVDFVVIGAGYAGLSAARALAQSRASVLVLEERLIGDGASARNHGFVGFVPRLSYLSLQRRLGTEYASRVFGEYRMAHDAVVQLMQSGAVACRYVRCGRIYWANTRRQFRARLAEAQASAQALKAQLEVLEGRALPALSAARGMVGAFRYPETGTCHPAQLLHGLLSLAEQSGARVVSGQRATIVSGRDGSMVVKTASGLSVSARRVLVATNGYTTAQSSIASGVIPVHAHAIATMPLSPEQKEAIFHHAGTHLNLSSDYHSWSVVPGETRVVLIGAAGGYQSDAVARLKGNLRTLYPALAEVPISHYWSGRMGFTFDRLPHVFHENGVHYAVGCNGVGIPIAVWMGGIAAQHMLGTQTDSVFATPLKRLPGYRGGDWFLPLMSTYARSRAMLERFGL
jgi:glycine/D-amino acid oxidase-like deaminating enzyme